MSDSQLPFDVSQLPVAHLESLKFKANQIIESIVSLQRTIDAGVNVMPSWPDILSKYNILLSQTHNFSNSLLTPIHHGSSSNISRINGSTANQNPYEKIALHPHVGMTDKELDNEIIPLLRNQQTTEVLKLENQTVRRLSEHMATRGSVGVLGGVPPPSNNPFGSARKPEYDDVLRECQQIKEEHDKRADRAFRAVTMLRDKYDWKTRVQVEVEEPEELEWDPRVGIPDTQSTDAQGETEDVDVGDTPEEEGDANGDGGSSDEDEVEGELVNMSTAETHTPTPSQTVGAFSAPTDGVFGSTVMPGRFGDTPTNRK